MAESRFNQGIDSQRARRMNPCDGPRPFKEKSNYEVWV